MADLHRRFPHVGELRVTESDAKLVELKRSPTNSRAFFARVEWEGDDLKKRFAEEIYTVGFGMKSVLAQGGVFGAIAKRGKTMEPDIAITDSKISASLLGSQYSSYPVEIWEKMEFGRFYNPAGAPFRRADILQLNAEQSNLGEPIYAPPSGGFSDYVDEEGSLTLTTRNLAFRVRDDYDLRDPENKIRDPEEKSDRRIVDATGRIRLNSRKHLKHLFESIDVGKKKTIEQGEFIVVDTHPLVMPPQISGLLMVDEFGMRIQPTHLNSPIVDSPFGHDKKDEFNGHLRLELYQPHPHGLRLEDVYVRLRFFREKVISAIAPEEGTQQNKLFKS